MRWMAIALVLVGCGGSEGYHCEDQCSGAASITIETGYYPDPRPTLVCTCAGSSNKFLFVEPTSVVACTTLRETFKDWLAQGCPPRN